MFCYNCGANIPDGSQFCVACGAPSAAQLVQQKPIAARPRKKRSFSAGTGFFGFIAMAVIILISIILLSTIEEEAIELFAGMESESFMARIAWSLLPVSVLAVYAGIRYFSANVRALLSVGLFAVALYLIIFAIKDIRTICNVFDDLFSDSDDKKYSLLSFIPKYIVFRLPGVMLAIYLGIKSITGTMKKSDISIAIMSCFAFELAVIFNSLFSAVSQLCNFATRDMDKEFVLMLGVYPLVYAVIKLMLIVFFFVSLDMLVPEGIKIKKNEAEESAE